MTERDQGVDATSGRGGSPDSSTVLQEIVALLRDLDYPYPTDLDVELVPTPGATRQSFGLPMRDGVTLAVDLHLPSPSLGPVPTCVRSTRYWRSTVDNPVFEHVGALEAARWTAAGFALVLVDARGTGASTGTWARGWDDEQRDDLVELLDWIVAQAWSDGTVGGYGTSYDGTAAQLLAATRHPAVRAVVPRFSTLDAYHHIAAPGGVPLDWFSENWAAINWHLDGHPDRMTVTLPVPLSGSVRPLDADSDGQALATARAEHADNCDLWETSRTATTRVEPLPDAGHGTPLARIDELREARVPTWLWSGWYDAAYAAAQLAQLADDALDVRVTIGPFAHGATMRPLGDPLLPELTNVPMAEQVEQIAAFLRDPTGDVAPRRLRYYRFGDGWHEANAWPPPHVRPLRLHLRSTGTLGPDGDEVARRYAVDHETSTGTSGTRWHFLGGPPVTYPDRREADDRLVVWDGDVLEHAYGITGSPVVHLDVVADREDFAAHVYLEAVLPTGKVLYLTEGQLRASHRALGNGPAPYEHFGPWHPHTDEALQPVVPGEVTSLDFALWPISVLLPPGSRLRVALAGADQPLFRRIPSEGPVDLELQGSSWIDVPVEPGQP